MWKTKKYLGLQPHNLDWLSRCLVTHIDLLFEDAPKMTTAPFGVSSKQFHRHKLGDSAKNLKL